MGFWLQRGIRQLRILPLAMLGLAVRRHGPGRNFRPTVQAPQPPPLSFPVEWALPSNPAGVRNLGLSAVRAIWLAGHDDSLVYIHPQSEPVEEARQDVQGLLEPGRPWGGEEPVIHIKRVRPVSIPPPPKPSAPASSPTTNLSQWQITASATILKMVGDNGFPCVTPLEPLNGAP